MCCAKVCTSGRTTTNLFNHLKRRHRKERAVFHSGRYNHSHLYVETKSSLTDALSHRKNKTKAARRSGYGAIHMTTMWTCMWRRFMFVMVETDQSTGWLVWRLLTVHFKIGKKVCNSDREDEKGKIVTSTWWWVDWILWGWSPIKDVPIWSQRSVSGTNKAFF